MRTNKTFSIAFPDIADLDLTLEESGKAGISQFHTRKFSHASVTRTIKCSNPDCHKGGFDVASVVWQMVSNQSTNVTESIKCKGLEGHPQSKRKRNPCLNEFKYSIELKYKQPHFQKVI